MPAFHLALGDANAWLRSLPDESVDLVVTDPPYESLEADRAIGTTTRLRDWFPVEGPVYLAGTMRQLYRVLRTDRHLYWFSDHRAARWAVPALEAAEFEFHKPLIWDKRRIGMGYHYRARYEMILFASKGSRPLNDRGVPDVLSVAAPRGGYPTEKPVALLRTLVTQSTLPGELVVDPFMGSGSTGHAALDPDAAPRRFMGCDVGGKALVLARDRLGHLGTETAAPFATGQLLLPG